LAHTDDVFKGHCHPKIVATLVEQAQKLTLSSRAFYNSVFPRFAKQMKDTFGYDRVLPMNTGAEAVETALKLARTWACDTPTKDVDPGKAIILTAAGNFHGKTLGTIRLVLFIHKKSILTYSCAPSHQYEYGSEET
jgi:ornithine--oxo-acid transaminase